MKAGGIEYFRNKIFYSIFIIIMITSMPIYIWYLIIYLRKGDILVIAHIFSLLWGVMLIKIHIFSETIRKILVIVSMYAAAIMMIISTGIEGEGMSLILYAIVFSGFILDEKYSIRIIFVDILAFFLLTILLFGGYFDNTPMETYKSTWIMETFGVHFLGITSFFLMNLIFNGLKGQVVIIEDANQIIMKSEEKLKKMISNICDVIVIVDRENIIKFVSSNIYNIYGWKPDELLNHTLLETIYCEDRDFIAKDLDILFRSKGFKKTIEIRYY